MDGWMDGCSPFVVDGPVAGGHASCLFPTACSGTTAMA